jgi:hypothetical protein
MRQERVQFANTLRWIAAIAVLLSHYTFVFWTSREAVANLIHTAALPDQFAFRPVCDGCTRPSRNLALVPSGSRFSS